MKKTTALFLVLVMVCSLFSGCSMIKNKIKQEIKDTIGDAISDVTDGLSDGSGSISDILNGIGGDIAGAIGDAAGDAVSDAVGYAADGTIIATGGRHDPSYWCDKFGVNYCPFSITALGISLPYHFRDGGELDSWVYTEENTGGWYVYAGHIISDDNAFAIKIEDMDSLSSCCEYTAKAYTGEKLDKDERKSYFEAGVFYTLNSYTPIPTNWGIKFLRDESTDTFDGTKWQVYDIPAALFDQEYFNFYVGTPHSEYSEAIKLWAFPHQERSNYPEILTDKFMETGMQIGTFSYDDDSHSMLCRTFVPNKEAGGFDAGMVDLILTYGDDENVVAGVLTVGTGVGGKG